MNKYIFLHKRKFLVYVILATLSSFVTIFFTYIIQSLVDALVNSNFKNFYISLGLFLVFLVASYLINVITSISEASILKNIHIELKQKIFKNLLNQRFDKFNKQSLAYKVNLFENDFSVIEEYYFSSIFEILQNSFLLLMSVAYLIKLNIVLAILLVVCTILSLIIPLFSGKKMDDLTDKYSIKTTEFLNKIKDYFMGFDVIKSYQIEASIFDNFDKILENVETNLFQLKKKSSYYNQNMSTAHYIIIIACFSVGGGMTLKRVISLGELIAVTQVINFIVQPIQIIGNSLMEIHGSKQIRKKIDSILHETNDSLDETEMAMGFKKLTLENISYSINKRVILNNINFTFEKGKKYAVVGESGSGKTTLLKVISQFLEIDNGEFILNNQIRGKSLKSLHNLLSFIHQDTFIFVDTLLENIRLYQNCSEGELKTAIHQSLLKDKISEVGLEYKCEDNGQNLSGGEKQRISTARALLRDSELFLLDEVTSSLDMETSEKLEKNLLSMEAKTMIFVTHKLSEEFLSNIDCIICMKDGQILEKGTVEELIRAKGYFYELYHSVTEV